MRLGPLRRPPGKEGCPAQTRPDQRTGSSGQTPGSSPDRQGSAVRLAHQWELSDATAEGWGTVRPVSKGPDSAARGPPAGGDSEAWSNQKFRHASEAEAALAASDSRDKARTAPVSFGPKTGQLRPEPPRRPTRCVSMASDVASQWRRCGPGSGSALAGSTSGEGRTASGAEARDRWRSPGRGPPNDHHMIVRELIFRGTSGSSLGRSPRALGPWVVIR